MAKIIAPAGMGSIFCDDRVFELTHGHVIDVSDAAAALLCESFGFERWVEANDVPAPVEVPAGIDPASLNRNQLFAALKALGVAVAPPITNDALRAMLTEKQAPAAPVAVVAAEPVVAAPVEPPAAVAPVVTPPEAPVPAAPIAS